MKTHYQLKELSYLIFTLGKEQFAVNVNKIIEVIRNTELTEVPRTEKYIEGIINFRGDIVTVVNTKRKINLADKKEIKNPVIIVFELQFDGKIVRLGALADKVKKVIEISEDEIQAVPDFGSYFNPEFLEGAINTPQGFTMILDIEKIFSAKDVEIIKKIEEKQIEKSF
ncbi:MAG: purine-binding chemotaxis protein CheW [Bacteroidales bacterium]|nr:purine-binding chemotaxis protein CheW [Bacteroidales bacterium]